MVKLFETIFTKSASGESERAPAAILTDQHRMHPNIAELVGRILYPDEEGGTILHSPPEIHDRLKGSPPFTIPTTLWLPQQRVVWCDVPWERKEECAEARSRGCACAAVAIRMVPEMMDLNVAFPGDHPPCAAGAVASTCKAGGYIINMDECSVTSFRDKGRALFCAVEEVSEPSFRHALITDINRPEGNPRPMQRQGVEHHSPATNLVSFRLPQPTTFQLNSRSLCAGECHVFSEA